MPQEYLSGGPMGTLFDVPDTGEVGDGTHSGPGPSSVSQAGLPHCLLTSALEEKALK